MKKKINFSLAVLFLAVASVLFSSPQISHRWWWGAFCLVMTGLHVYLGVQKGKTRIQENTYISGKEKAPFQALTELVLLNEKNEKMTSWNLYGKNGLVIGRDVGENQVDINLEQTTYASMIEVEHAVLNFSGNDWYIEDISSKNGVSIQKTDGKKYKIAYGKPCRLERGDIIYVTLTRLQII